MDTSIYEIQSCSLCNGQGTSLGKNRCPDCQGTGRVLAPSPTFEQLEEREDAANQKAQELECLKVQKWLLGPDWDNRRPK
jgi:RecJ-like exonuclease